jgi:hypothetical protein
MKWQTGQSMAEFAVCATAISLILLGTGTISGYQEVQRRMIVASRQAAFESGWLGDRLDAQSLSSRLAALHFDDPALIDTTGHSPVVDTDNVRVTSGTVSVPGQAAIATNFLLTPLRAAGGFLGGGFDLDQRGFRTGAVSVQIQANPHLPAPFAELRLQFDQRYALLTDAWNAANPGHVTRRAGALVPARALASLSGLWQALLAPVSLVEPSLRELCLGVIEPDRVPEDRLEPGKKTGVTC